MSRHNRRGLVYRNALGPNLVEIFHIGVITPVSGNAATWRGLFGKLTLSTAVGHEPPFAADGTAFGGKKAVQAAVAGSLYLQGVAAANLFASGSRPWLGLVCRMRANNSGARVICVGLDSPVTQILGGFTTNAGTSLVSQFSGNAATATNSATSVRLLESSLDSSGTNVLEENGVQIAASGVGLTLSAAMREITFGANSAGANGNDVSGVIIALCTSRPLSAQRTAFLNLSRVEFPA